MNILMLGGSGYLGTNIVKVLSNENNNIFCVIRRTSDIKYLKMFSNVKFIANDIGQIDLTLQQEKIDWVFNGVGSYRSNSFKYEEMLESNVFFSFEYFKFMC